MLKIISNTPAHPPTLNTLLHSLLSPEQSKQLERFKRNLQAIVGSGFLILISKAKQGTIIIPPSIYIKNQTIDETMIELVIQDEEGKMPDDKINQLINNAISQLEGAAIPATKASDISILISDILDKSGQFLPHVNSHSK